MTGSAADLDLRLMRAATLLDADPAAAARAANEVLEALPGHAAASLLLATACLSLGDSARACEVLESLAHVQPASAIVQLELGRAYRAARRSDESLAALRRADIEWHCSQEHRGCNHAHPAEYSHPCLPEVSFSE